MRIKASSSLATAQTINATVGAYSCGFASEPLICNGVPVTLAGETTAASSFWLDVHTTGYYIGSGFIMWQGWLNADLGESTITGISPVYTKVTSGRRTATEITSLTVTFTGTGYTGTMTLQFGYYYSAGGGGRGGGGAGWRRQVNGGTVQINEQPMANSPIAPTPTSCPECK